MNVSTQQMQKAGQAKDPRELLALARAEGIPMTEGEARDCFIKLHPPAGELADDELDAVSGGGCGGSKGPYVPEYPVGAYVQFKARCSGTDLNMKTAHEKQCTCKKLEVTAAYDYKVPTMGVPLHYGANDLRCTGCGAQFKAVEEYDLEDYLG